MQSRIIAFYIAITGCILAVIIYIIYSHMYASALMQHRQHLLDMVQVDAMMLNSAARSEEYVFDGNKESHATRSEILKKLTHAFTSSEEFKNKGGYTLVAKNGDHIEYIYRHRYCESFLPDNINWNMSDSMPIHKDLEGSVGTSIVVGTRGHKKLAAYGYARDIGIGIVRYIDLWEIRYPILIACATFACIAVVGIASGLVLIMRYTNSMASNIVEYKNRYQAFFCASCDAILVLDESDHVVSWNSSATQLFGYSYSEISNMHIDDIISGWCGISKTYIPADEKSAKNDNKHHSALPAHVHLRDGSDIPVTISLSNWISNQGICSTLIIRDMSKQVESERMHARLKLAIDAADETIVMTDTEGAILYANPAFEKITGYSLGEVVGKNPRALNSGMQDREFYEALWNTISCGKVWHGHFINKKKDGTLYHEDATISPVKDDNGLISNYVAVKRDVTKQRILENQLHQAQKLESIGQLAAGIAHEINTPMQYIGDNARFIRDSVRDLLIIIEQYDSLFSSAKECKLQISLADVSAMESAIEDLDFVFVKEEIVRAIEQTLDGVDRVTEIVKAMKDYSHPGTEEKTPTDLNKAIESTITVCRNRWKYVADLELDLDKDLPLVSCFAGEFNQVILNMVVNAADAIHDKIGNYCGEKGRIKIATRQDSDGIEIQISDSGGGIPLNIQQKIFDPFFTTKEVGKGTGQGLAICYDVIVNRHSGKIHFEVDHDVGTTFVIRMPIISQSRVLDNEAA